MNYACFFCGSPTRVNGDICDRHEQKISSPNAEILRTRPSNPWPKDDEGLDNEAAIS